MRRTTLGVSFGVLLTIAGAGLLLTECSDSNLGTPENGDAAAGCPANPPTPGTSCLLPNNTVCNSYPQPGCECCNVSSGFECSNGKWVELPSAAGAPAGFACPSTVPEAGSACSTNPCGGAQPECPYDVACGDGFLLSTASCVDGEWSITPVGSACSIDAGDDAGDGGDGG